jgi:hypothetical protein
VTPARLALLAVALAFSTWMWLQLAAIRAQLDELAARDECRTMLHDCAGVADRASQGAERCIADLERYRGLVLPVQQAIGGAP